MPDETPGHERPPPRPADPAAREPLPGADLAGPGRHPIRRRPARRRFHLGRRGPGVARRPLPGEGGGGPLGGGTPAPPAGAGRVTRTRTPRPTRRCAAWAERADGRLLLGQRRRPLRHPRHLARWTTWAAASRRSPRACSSSGTLNIGGAGWSGPCRCWPRPSRRCGGRSGGSRPRTTRTSLRPTSGCGRPPPGTASSSSGSCGPTTWPTRRAGRACSPGSRPRPAAGPVAAAERCSSTACDPAPHAGRGRADRRAVAVGHRGRGGDGRRGRAAEQPGGPGTAPAASSTTCPRGTTLPPGFRLVLREIDRYLATRPTPAAAGDRPGADRRGPGGRPAARGAQRRADRRPPAAPRPRRR